jgi:hypothetical protein
MKKIEDPPPRFHNPPKPPSKEFENICESSFEKLTPSPKFSPAHLHKG